MYETLATLTGKKIFYQFMENKEIWIVKVIVQFSAMTKLSMGAMGTKGVYNPALPRINIVCRQLRQRHENKWNEVMCLGEISMDSEI